MKKTRTLKWQWKLFALLAFVGVTGRPPVAQADDWYWDSSYSYSYEETVYQDYGWSDYAYQAYQSGVDCVCAVVAYVPSVRGCR